MKLGGGRAEEALAKIFVDEWYHLVSETLTQAGLILSEEVGVSGK
jgi:hypothetical protein